MIELAELRERVQNLRESLDTELKAWIEPATPAGIAKIARGCIALRNNNGGTLFIGFDDKTGKPVVDGKPAIVAIAFHADVIQGIVSKYASEPFAVDVICDEWEIEGQPFEYVAVQVPSGVQTPVAAKSELASGTPKPLVAQHIIYIRSIHSGKVSSAPIRHNEWRDFMRKLRGNHEADIGDFLRRHLTSDAKSVLLDFLAEEKPKPTALD
ncbi:MAG TPA: RNA-binding domain-containing protein, partial [Pirellulales bacterium]